MCYWPFDEFMHFSWRFSYVDTKFYNGPLLHLIWKRSFFRWRRFHLQGLKTGLRSHHSNLSDKMKKNHMFWFVLIYVILNTSGQGIYLTKNKHKIDANYLIGTMSIKVQQYWHTYSQRKQLWFHSFLPELQG